MSERDRIIADAREHGIDLDPSDFRRDGDGWTLDGMNPAEWLHAMTMDGPTLELRNGPRSEGNGGRFSVAVLLSAAFGCRV